MFFRHRLDCTQHAAEDAQRNFATHSFNDMEHPSSSTATRVDKRAATLAVESGLWSLSTDAGRDCTISTPTMNDTRIKWNTFTLKKKVMVTQFPSETERHCEAKQQKKAICTSHSIVCGFHRTGSDTLRKHAQLVMVHLRSGEPLVASSAQNLFGDSTYLRWDLNEKNGGTVRW